MSNVDGKNLNSGSGGGKPEGFLSRVPGVEDYGYPLQERSLSDVFDILWQGKWLILLCFIVVMAATLTYTLRATPEYESTVTLVVDGPRTGSSPNLGLESITSPSIALREPLKSEIEVLRRSLVIAERVADRMLAQPVMPRSRERYPLLVRLEENGVPLNSQNLARYLPSRIKVNQVEDVNIFAITGISSNAEEASMIANLYGEEYIQHDRTVSRANLQATEHFLEELEGERGEDLRMTEDQIRQFLEGDWTMVLDPTGQKAAAEIAGLTTETERARFELDMQRAYVRMMEEEMSQVQTTINNRMTSDSRSRMEAMRAAIVQLDIKAEEYYVERPDLRTSPERSPDLIAILDRRDNLRRRVEEIADEYRTGVLQDEALEGESLTAYLLQLRMETARERARIQEKEAKLAHASAQLDNYQRDLVRLLRQGVNLSHLEREKRISESLYMLLLQRLQETRIAERSELGRVQVVTPAFVPSSPVRPNKIRNIFAGFLLGIVGGIGLAFLRHSMDNRVRDPEGLRKKGFAVIATVPDMSEMIKQEFGGKEKVTVDGLTLSTRLATLLDPLSSRAEAYRRLRTNIQFSKVDGGVHSIVVTSGEPGEGKSITALNLAIIMAQAGKRTLFVDADLRRPTAHAQLGLKREPGLTDILFHTLPFTPENFGTGIDNLFVVPAGTTVPNPSELLGSKKMQEFLKFVRDHFDMVILDTPPVQVVSDAALVGVQCDATILVAAAGETELDALTETRSFLEDVGVTIIGTVLNRFDPSDSYGYRKYGYRYKYKDRSAYYGYYAEQKPRGSRSAGKAAVGSKSEQG